MPYKDPIKEKNQKIQWAKDHPEYQKEYGIIHKKEKIEYDKKRYNENKDKNIQKSQEYYKLHKEDRLQYAKKYKEKNKEKKIKEKTDRLKYLREYRKENPEFFIMRKIINRMLKTNKLLKTSKSYEYLGCSPGFLRNHLESLFQPGMNWENYGRGKDKWNVDHIIPLSWWDLKNNPEHLFIASHWSNLQPMWEPENLRKKDKYASI